MGKCKRCGKEVRFQSSPASFIMLHSTCWELEVSKVVEIFCDKYCRFPNECKNQDELYEHCDSCELVELFNIGGDRFREGKVFINASAEFSQSENLHGTNSLREFFL